MFVKLLLCKTWVMKNIIVFFLITFFCRVNLCAQGNLFEYTPSLTCEDAPIVCQLDGFSSSTGGPNATDQPSTFCGSVQNNHWISFLAGSDTLIFHFNIGQTLWGNGVQAQVFAVCGGFWPTASNCIFEGTVGTIMELKMYNLTVGDRYYLMVDGRQGDQCEYSIEVTKGSIISSDPDIVPDAGNDILYDCITQEIELDGSNSIYGMTDSVVWVREDLSVVSDSISFVTNQAGTFYLVIYPEDGDCPSYDEVQVLTIDDILPDPFLPSFIEISTDTFDQAVFLDAVNSNVLDSNYTFLWTTNFGNIVAHADSIFPLISSQGLYFLEVTHIETGCKKTNQVVVDFITSVDAFSGLKNQLQVEIFPNVVTDYLQFKLFTERSTSVSAQIYSSGGNLLKDFDFGKKWEGEHIEEIRLGDDFAGGIYYIIIETEEGRVVRKFVKL